MYIHELILSGLQTNPPLFVDTMARLFKDELSFVKEVPEDIECPVCLNILTDPHQVTCCGNNFCKSCIERVKAGDGACPMCKEKNYQSFVDKKCLRIINGLQVYCSNQKEGCQWKGELKSLSTHTNRGKREGECLYQEVKCRYKECGSKGQRRHLGQHEENRCPQRPFKCAHCNTEGTYHFITKEHVKICSKVPTPCPNKCTDALLPKDMVPVHLNKCPLQPVDCMFSWAGCKEKPLRKDIEPHTTDAKHMMLLAVACGKLKKENEILKKTCDQLKKENEALKKEHSYTRDFLGVVAADTRPMLPITVTREDTHPLLPITVTRNKVVHFYTEVGGYHMSATFMPHTNTIYLAFHEGKFDRIMKLADYPQIHFNQGNSKIFQLSVVKSCTKLSDDILTLFFNSAKKNTSWPGIISCTYPSREIIDSLKITLIACNKIAVCSSYTPNIFAEFILPVLRK